MRLFITGHGPSLFALIQALFALISLTSQLVSATSSDCDSSANSTGVDGDGIGDGSGSGLLAGRARVDITPPINPNWLPLNEFDLEKLHVRAIVFENNGVRGAFTCAEVANYEQLVYQNAAELVAKYLNTSAAHIVFSATHTHGASAAGTGLFFSTHNYGNEEVNQYANLGEAALEAVKEASANMVPAKIGYATGDAYLNVNRDHLNPNTGRWTQYSNFFGPVDREIQILTFVNHNDTPIAVYANYLMHPVNSYLCGYTSADWPGAMSRWIEKSFDEKMVAIYVQSASGDVNPRCRRTGTNVLASIGHMPITGLELAQEAAEQPIRNFQTPLDRPDVAYVRQLFSELTAIGIVMGEEMIRLMSKATEWDDNPTIWGKMANITCPGRKRLDKAREGVPGMYTNGTDIDVMTGVLGLGKTVIATVGAEIFTRIGWRIKEESSMENTFLSTMSNGWSASGYIPDVASWPQEVFQALGSNLMPGSCAEDKITESLVDFIAEYKKL
ncbi:hypothetical protein V491_01977 [Pseudogymnoascus sp. VKM F-3775]|nr:hypothetical protein V491_01977 [Pseudogymnoascus sp. VKM F-3775]